MHAQHTQDTHTHAASVYRYLLHDCKCLVQRQQPLTAEKGWNTTPDSCTSSCAACTLTLRLDWLLGDRQSTDSHKSKKNVSCECWR